MLDLSQEAKKTKIFFFSLVAQNSSTNIQTSTTKAAVMKIFHGTAPLSRNPKDNQELWGTRWRPLQWNEENYSSTITYFKLIIKSLNQFRGPTAGTPGVAHGKERAAWGRRWQDCCWQQLSAFAKEQLMEDSVRHLRRWKGLPVSEGAIPLLPDSPGPATCSSDLSRKQFIFLPEK